MPFPLGAMLDRYVHLHQSQKAGFFSWSLLDSFYKGNRIVTTYCSLSLSLCKRMMLEAFLFLATVGHDDSRERESILYYLLLLFPFDYVQWNVYWALYDDDYDYDDFCKEIATHVPQKNPRWCMYVGSLCKYWVSLNGGATIWWWLRNESGKYRSLLEEQRIKGKTDKSKVSILFLQVKFRIVERKVSKGKAENFLWKYQKKFDSVQLIHFSHFSWHLIEDYMKEK